MMHVPLAMSGPPPEQEDHIAERMAAFIVEQLEKAGVCSTHDVRANGFSLNDVARYWPEACRIAEIKQPGPGHFRASER
jgi:hypothetical protein